jgi:hypothetical protein
MANKKRNPAAVATASGAKGIAVFPENTASIAQTVAAANGPAIIIAIRRGPGGKAAWLVTVKGDGMCIEDAPMRKWDLGNYYRFCLGMLLRFGIRFDQLMPQGAWEMLVTRAKGGPS